MNENSNLTLLASPVAVSYSDSSPEVLIPIGGFTKHEEATIKLAAGLLANPYIKSDTEDQLKSIADTASKLAEIILAK